jgi:hypothetical protein
MALTKITSSLISNNTISVTNIADNAIDATKIASNSILTRHIDDNQINIDQLNVVDGTSGQALTTNGAGALAFLTLAQEDLLVFGRTNSSQRFNFSSARSGNVSVPITAGNITVVARSGNVSVGVS